jgi:hypothetical protein
LYHHLPRGFIFARPTVLTYDSLVLC